MTDHELRVAAEAVDPLQQIARAWLNQTGVQIGFIDTAGVLAAFHRYMKEREPDSGAIFDDWTNVCGIRKIPCSDT